MTGDSNDETNFLHKLLLTGKQVLRLHKAFANDSSASINVSNCIIFKFQLSKLGGVIPVIPTFGNILWSVVKRVIDIFRSF